MYGFLGNDNPKTKACTICPNRRGFARKSLLHLLYIGKKTPLQKHYTPKAKNNIGIFTLPISQRF
jgi:hypothetical protein